MGLPAERISAVSTPGKGILGCGKSHVIAIESFLKSGADYALIFEDDFIFTEREPAKVQDVFRQFFKSSIPWDVVMLSGNVMKDTDGPAPFLRKVLDAQTTSGYMVTKAFAPQLLHNLREGVMLLEQHFNRFGKSKHEYCLDIYWKKLQPQNRWYIFHPKLGTQMESFSDIVGGVTNYGV